MIDTEHRVDGNAVAGMVGELLGVEATTGHTTCHTCGRASLLAEHHAYLNAPGAVLRCPHCENVTLRVVRAGTRVHVDLSGLRTVTLDSPPDG